MMFIESTPYPYPYNGDFRADNTALVIIDMQIDFCGKGGYVDRMGYDLFLTRRAIEPIKRLLEAARNVDGFTIIHTREGHREDLSDLPANKKWRSKQIGAEIGSGKTGEKILSGFNSTDKTDSKFDLNRDHDRCVRPYHHEGSE